MGTNDSGGATRGWPMRAWRVTAMWLLFGALHPAAGQFAQPGTKLIDIPSYMTNIAKAMSQDGNTAFVSMTCYSGCDAGNVYTFNRTSSGWVSGPTIGLGSLPHGGIGWALAVSESGGTLIAGALRDVFRFMAGDAFIVSSAGSSWNLEAELPAGNGGVAISGDGNTVVVSGADLSPTSANTGTWVYVRAGTTWTQQTKLSVTAGGVVLSRDGNTVVLNGLELYERSGSTWSRDARYPGAGFTAISADGKTIVSGDSILQRIVGMWTQVDSIPGTGTPAAFANDLTTMLRNGLLYRKANGVWTSVADGLPDGSVRLSGNGSVALVTVALGTPAAAVWAFTQQSPQGIPVLSGWLGLWLALLLAGAGIHQLRNRCGAGSKPQAVR